MRDAWMLVRVALIVGLSLALVACAGTTKVRLSARKMCEAHGGTYSAQQQQCTYTPQTRNAQTICEQQGGVYWPDEQYCEIEAGI